LTPYSFLFAVLHVELKLRGCTGIAPAFDEPNIADLHHDAPSWDRNVPKITVFPVREKDSRMRSLELSRRHRPIPFL